MIKSSKVLIAIADDHIMVRNSISNTISTFPGFEVIIKADNGQQMIDSLNKADPFPDICILDIQMPVMNGYETMTYIKEKWPDLKVLALSMLDDEFSIIRMLKHGAQGYLVKGNDIDELQKALEYVYTKGFYCSELVSSNIIHFIHKDDGKDQYKINEKEIEFLKLCCTEFSIKEIAKEMNVSTRTAQGYRGALFDKLNLSTRQGLVMFAIKSGIVSLDEL